MFRALIADDLSGAADGSAALGRPVRVAFWPALAWDSSLDPDVIQVYDTESRSLSPTEAGARVWEACASLPWKGVYKKVDSTLRGNPGAEIEAALQGTGKRLAVLAPSFPSQGRTVRGGVLRIHGVPVTNTPFAVDPRTPVRHDRVAEIIRATSSLEVFEVPAADIPTIGSGIAVVDAETEEDLRALALLLGEEVLPVGSAGLAHALAALDPGSRPSPPRSPCRIVVVLVGSGHPSARAQASEVRESDRVILRMGSSPTELVTGLAGMLRERPAAVVATGGETALAACRALGAKALWPLGEVAPGVAISSIEGVDGVLLASKAGGFGPVAVLRDVVDRLLGIPVGA